MRHAYRRHEAVLDFEFSAAVELHGGNGGGGEGETRDASGSGEVDFVTGP
jgi:hypothetical protein